MRKFLLLCASIGLFGCIFLIFVKWAPSQATPVDGTAGKTSLRWWKGNLHTHSLWSDGDDYPEMIVDWYKRNGYHFLALSDHNILSEGQKWIDVAKSSGGMAAFNRYSARFDTDWVERRQQDGKLWARLKPLNEFRALFEEPSRFLLIQGEEITDRFNSLPVHLNATNLIIYIPPQSGSSVLDTMQNNVNAVLKQQEETGQPMIVHVNHPNYGWAITAEEMAALKGERFFEVYNGHPYVRNYGNAKRASAERMWDIILTRRLAEMGGEIMYGIAVDDAHNYHEQAADKSNAGRGWVMVRSKYLTPESLIAAIEAGDFYASTGVSLNAIDYDGEKIRIDIQAKPGVTYTTQFIGTRRGYDRDSEPVIVMVKEQPVSVTRRYSDDVGLVLAQINGVAPSYTLKGDEIYVRAKIISSKKKENPYAKGEVEVAWTQPVVPGNGM